MMRAFPILAALAWAGLLLVIAGCGGPPDALGGIPVAIGPQSSVGIAGTLAITGQVTYDKKLVTDQGLQGPFVTQPVRRADVTAFFQAVGGSGMTSTTVATDDSGLYTLKVPQGSTVQVACFAASVVDGRHHLGVVNNPNLSVASIYAVTSPQFVLNAPASVNLHAVTSDAAETAGAFNILDDAETADQLVINAVGTNVRAAFVWKTGVPGPSQTSGSTVTIAGGIAGQIPTSDTDEFDDSVIIHEFGHAVSNTISRSDSLGGQHDPTTQLCPTLAYNEGFSDAFSGLVLKSQIYRDSLGVGGGSSLSVRLNLEANDTNAVLPYTQKAFGIASEESTYTLIYNFAHGAGGIPNGDSGTVQIGPLPILEAAKSYASNNDNYVYIGTLLGQLVNSGFVSTTQVTTVIGSNGGQKIQFPVAFTADDFPAPHVVGDTVNATVDGTTFPNTPAPNPNLSANASRQFFRLKLANPTTVTIATASSVDVDLYILDTKNNIEAKSVTRGSGNESVAPALVAGTHIIVVTGIVPDILVDPSLPVSPAPSGVSGSFTLTLR